MRIMSTVLGALLATLSISTLACESNSFNPLARALIQKDASNYAAKLAAKIQDRPECNKFKREILDQGSGSRYDGATIGPMVATMQKASAAGCTK